MFAVGDAANSSANNKVKDSSVDGGEEEEEEEKVKEDEGEAMMFDILSVNAYGSQTLMKLKKDGSELKLGGACAQLCAPVCVVYVCMCTLCVHTSWFWCVYMCEWKLTCSISTITVVSSGNLYLACDWEEWKEKCYSEDKAEVCAHVCVCVRVYYMLCALACMSVHVRLSLLSSSFPEPHFHLIC